MDAESITIVEPFPTSDSMQSQADFLKQAEEAQNCLRQFVCIKDLQNCDQVITPALHRLIKETVSIYFIWILSVLMTI